MRKREYRRYLIPAAVLVGVLIAIPIVLDPGVFFPTTPTPPPTYVTANLTLGAAVGTHLASPFYSVVWHVAGLPTSSLVAEGAFFNTTPISFYRIGGEGDGYDPTTETEYLPPSSGVGAYVALHSFEVNYTWFASWCRARSPTCQWLDYLPGEVNNTQLAIHTAEWFHSVLDFVPNAWQFGNEPDRWSHYGENRSQFSTFDNATPSAMAYATMERNYHAAVAALFPTDHFIGIEASCVCDTSLITATAALNGANVSAMAYHAYPGPPSTNSPLPDFYGSLETGQNLSSASGHFRTNVLAGCAGCANLPIQVGEYQTGPPIDHSPYAMQYPGAPFLAASVIQALEANVSTFTVYDNSWLINSTTGAILPQGLLYQRILDNMTMGTDYAAGLSATGLSGVYAMVVHNGSRESLLLVNTNTNTGLNLTVPVAAFPVGGPGAEWSWGPTESAPSYDRVGSLPESYQVPPQGILLLDNY